MKKYLFTTRGVKWSLLTSISNAVLGVAVAGFILAKLDPITQGYYYTFSSLMIVTILFEMGITTCIVQFLSHEFARLKFARNGFVVGPIGHKKRFLHIAKMSMKWFGGAGCVFFFSTIIGGLVFFNGNVDLSVSEWRTPWILLCFGTALSFPVNSLIAVTNGANLIDWTSKIRFFQNFVRAVTLILFLYLDFGLISLGLATLTGHIVALILAMGQLKLAVQIFRFRETDCVSWFKEIFPMQWRLAVSWLSGYLIYSTFIPILFKFIGPVEAGRFGLTWSIIQTVSSLGQAFVLPLAPEFGRLLSLAQFSLLRSVWRSAAIQGALIIVLAGFGLCGTLYAVRIWDSSLADRFLPVHYVFALSAAMFLNQITFSITVLVRAERREPFMWQSVAAGVFVIGGNIVFCVFSISQLIPVYFLLVQSGLLVVCYPVLKSSPIFTEQK